MSNDFVNDPEATLPNFSPVVSENTIPSQAAVAVQPRPHPNRRMLTRVGITGLIVVILLLVGASLFLLLQPTEETTVEIPIVKTLEILPTAQVAHIEYLANGIKMGDQLPLADGNSIQITPWDGESRFTFLLTGLDRRAGETGITYRTDTLMLISIDPGTQSVGILSIPRDMYVQVPGYSQRQRINTPMVLGELQKSGYGPELLMQTVQLNLGMPVNDYLAVDFSTFIGLVDAIGGIDIENPFTINDRTYPDLNYGYDPFYLPAGLHHLDGYDALRYARTRHGDGDINRAKRQQQVIFSIRDKILSAEMIPQLIVQSPQLWNAFKDNVFTGLTLEEIIQLGLYLKDVPIENITTAVIDYNYLSSYTTPQGASVLIPSQGSLSNLMASVFGMNYNQQ